MDRLSNLIEIMSNYSNTVTRQQIMYLIQCIEERESIIDDLQRDFGAIPQDALPTSKVREENTRLREALRKIENLRAYEDDDFETQAKHIAWEALHDHPV